MTSNRYKTWQRPANHALVMAGTGRQRVVGHTQGCHSGQPRSPNRRSVITPVADGRDLRDVCATAWRP